MVWNARALTSDPSTNKAPNWINQSTRFYTMLLRTDRQAGSGVMAFSDDSSLLLLLTLVIALACIPPTSITISITRRHMIGHCHLHKHANSPNRCPVIGFLSYLQYESLPPHHEIKNWCRRAEMQKVIKIAKIHFWPNKNSTKKWPKNNPKWPKNDILISGGPTWDQK